MKHKLCVLLDDLVDQGVGVTELYIVHKDTRQVTPQAT